MTVNTNTRKRTPELELGGKYLSFLLGKEDYAIDILRVKEIIAMQTITPLPRLPEYVKGVINLRGRIIPVLDLRLRLDLPAAEFDRQTCIIVVEVDTDREDEQGQVGCIVDTVNEVLDVRSEQVETAPSFSGSVDTEVVLGLAKMEAHGKVVALLDVQEVLATLELPSVAAGAA